MGFPLFVCSFRSGRSWPNTLLITCGQNHSAWTGVYHTECPNAELRQALEKYRT